MMLGHLQLSTTERYVHLHPEFKKEMLRDHCDKLYYKKGRELGRELIDELKNPDVIQRVI